jgi:hypothetical protein
MSVTPLRESSWEEIRLHFSEDEKRRINAAYAGERVCPKTMYLDDDKLGDALKDKLHRLLADKVIAGMTNVGGKQ